MSRLDDVKPVAYWSKTERVNGLDFKKPENAKCVDEIVPLYTREQLMPKVRFTQAEFDELKELIDEDYSLYESLVLIFDHNSVWSKLFERSNEDLVKFAQLWANYNPEHPEETIEIIKQKKWFVRVDSQIPVPDENIYLDDELIVYPNYNSPKGCAHQFDTKEEAEHWTNPLTEAVELEVE